MIHDARVQPLRPGTPRRELRIEAKMNPAAQESTGREDDGRCLEAPAIHCHHPLDRAAVEHQARGGTLGELQTLVTFQYGTYGPPIQPAVALGAR